jgi:hypothetical protein
MHAPWDSKPTPLYCTDRVHSLNRECWTLCIAPTSTRSAVDLPRDALCLCNGRLPRRGDRAVARGEGDVAGVACLFLRPDNRGRSFPSGRQAVVSDGQGGSFGSGKSTIVTLEQMMKKLLTYTAAAGCLMASISVAQARSPYDRSWDLRFVTQRGACDPTTVSRSTSTMASSRIRMW